MKLKMFGSKLMKRIREIEEDKPEVIRPKRSERKKLKSRKKSEETKSWGGKMELKEIKPPYPKCPHCDTYLEDLEIYNDKGKQKYGLEWTKGHKVKWVCSKCGAEYESEKEEEDEDLLTFKKEEPKHKVIYPKKKKR